MLMSERQKTPINHHIFTQTPMLLYLLMNSLSVLKLIIPALKAPLQNFQRNTEKSTEKMLKHFYTQLTSQTSEKDDRSFVPKIYEDLTEHLPIFLNKESEELKQQVESTNSNSSYANRRCQLQRNMLNNRIKSLQYEANSPCEDSLSYDQLKTINAYTVSIFDGHGGPELAEYSRSKINTFIDSFLHDHLKKPIADIGPLIKEALKWSYQKIEDTFFQTYQKQIKMGNKKMRTVGTCGITAIIHNDRVYVGNAGDSQAIFILNEGLGILKTSKACDRLSVNNRRQRQRLMKKWAGTDNQIITEQSKNVYYLKGRLQPTRSIGDYYLKKKEYYIGEDIFKGPYLSCIPEIDEHKITKSHKYMVIASDGIWDALSKNEVLNILMRGDQIDLNKTFNGIIEDQQPPYINNIVKNILGKASEMSGKSVQELKNMKKGARRNYHDDITLAVINLQNQLL